jgi:WD40 repeat protein
VEDVKFSPDGKLLLANSGRKRAYLWDVHSGKPYGPPLYHLA